MVDGTTNLNASQQVNGATVPVDIALDGTTNNFGGLVNASGADVTLVDGVGSLTLGTLNARGDVLVASAGPLDLGISTITGTLDASSGGGGNITQSGPLLVDGMATFTAGAGTVRLTNPGNDLSAGTTVLASSYKIEGDARQMASDLAARTKSTATAPVTAPGTGPGAARQAPVSPISSSGPPSRPAAAERR